MSTNLNIRQTRFIEKNTEAISEDILNLCVASIRLIDPSFVLEKSKKRFTSESTEFKSQLEDLLKSLAQNVNILVYLSETSK